MADTEIPTKTYRGNCHCGAFVYEAQLPEIKSATECNCSICYKKGYLWLMPPPGAFKVVKGSEDDLTAYTFGPGTTLHKVGSDLPRQGLCELVTLTVLLLIVLSYMWYSRHGVPAG